MAQLEQMGQHSAHTDSESLQHGFVFSFMLMNSNSNAVLCSS